MGLVLYNLPDRSPLWVNPEGLRLLGFSAVELELLRLDQLIHPDDWKTAFVSIEGLYRAKLSSFRMVKRFVRKDKAILWMDTHASVIRQEDRGGDVLMYLFRETDDSRSDSRKAIDENASLNFSNPGDLPLNSGGDILLPERASSGTPQPLRELIAALINRERTLKQAQSIAQLGIWKMHVDTQLLEWSDEAYRIFDVPGGRRLFYGDFLEMTHPDDREIVDRTWRSALEKNGVYDLEHRIVSGGGTKWVREQCEFELDHSGRPYMAVGVVKDITDQKLAKEQLEVKNKELQEVMDALDESSLVSIADKNGIILKVNRRFCEVAKFKEAELIGKSHNIINSGYHSKVFWESFWRTIKKGEVWRGEIRNRAKDGSEYWVNTTINPIRNEKGEIIHYLSIRQDITSRKIYEELLLQSNLRLAQIEQFIDLTTDAIQVSDLDGQFVYINQVASQRLGISRADCQKYNITDVESFFNNKTAWRTQVLQLKECNTIDIDGTSYDKSAGLFLPVEVTMRYISIHGKDYIIVVSRDITERKKNEMELRESQARLAEAQRMAKLGYCEYDFSTDSLWWSDEQYRIVGVAKSGLPPRPSEFLSMIHPDDRPGLIEMTNKTISTQAETSGSYRLIRPNGEVRVIFSNFNVIVNERGQPLKLSGVNQDITDRVNTENALRESEETLRKAQAVAKVGSWKLDVKTNLLQWSEEAYKIFNVPRDKTLTYADFLSYVHPEDKEYVHNSWAAALNGAAYDIVHRIIVDKKIKWVREQAELTFDDSRNLIYGFGTVQDVTDHKILQDSNMIFNQSLLLTGLGSWRVSFKNNDLFLSDNVYSLHGVPRDSAELTYETFLTLIYPEDRQRIQTLIKNVALEKGSFETEYRVTLPDQVRWLSANGKVLTDECGNAIEMYGIVRDITVEKTSTDELIKARKEAEEASSIKDEFLSVMSHEIRTPLNSVIGLSNLILKRSPRKDQLAIMQTLKGSADNLLYLVNDILDFNKIRAGKLELEYIPFRLTIFLQHLYASFKLSALDKQIDFSIHTDARIPDLLIGDVTRLNQIFNNLLGNAIKFTHDGYVKFRVDLKCQTEKECTLVFQIEDTGVGITADKIDSIFQPFQQSERDTSRKYGGTGLGLSIVKSLLQILNGHIQVQSMPGKGSNFKVELTFNHGVSTPVKNEFFQPVYTFEQPAVNSLTKTLHVLYVEDVESNRFLIENLLSDNNIDTTTVSSGKQALRLTKSESFDLILMDIQMPGMDGYETTRKIRSQIKGKNKSTPVLAFTAEPYSEELRRKVSSHGIRDVITKPFDADTLIDKIFTCTESQNLSEYIFSFTFYERAFHYDKDKLRKIKSAVIEDIDHFRKKLALYDKEGNWKGIYSEVHRIRPILRKLECDRLTGMLDSYDASNDSSTVTRKMTRSILECVDELIDAIAKLPY